MRRLVGYTYHNNITVTTGMVITANIGIPQEHIPMHVFTSHVICAESEEFAGMIGLFKADPGSIYSEYFMAKTG